jgi:hypothetical protein
MSNVLSKFDILKGSKLRKKKNLTNIKQSIAAQRIAIEAADTDFSKEWLQVTLELLMELENLIELEKPATKKRKKKDIL